MSTGNFSVVSWFSLNILTFAAPLSLRKYRCTVTFLGYVHVNMGVTNHVTCKELCIKCKNLPDFFFASTLSFSLTQFLVKKFTSRSLPEHPLQSKLVPLDRQMKHLLSPWSQRSLNWLGPILPLHMQASQDPWRVVSLLSKPAAQLLHSKSSFKFSLHLTQDIVPLSNSLHAADEMFLRHVTQWIRSLSVKLTAMRGNKTNVCEWLKKKKNQ